MFGRCGSGSNPDCDDRNFHGIQVKNTYDSHKFTKTIYTVFFIFDFPVLRLAGILHLRQRPRRRQKQRWRGRDRGDTPDDFRTVRMKKKIKKDLNNKIRKCFVCGICRVSRRSIRIRRAKITAAIRYRVTRSVTASLPYPPPLLSLTSSPTKKEERRKGVEWKTPPTTSLPPPSHKLKPYT